MTFIFLPFVLSEIFVMSRHYFSNVCVSVFITRNVFLLSELFSFLDGKKHLGKGARPVLQNQFKSLHTLLNWIQCVKFGLEVIALMLLY